MHSKRILPFRLVRCLRSYNIIKVRPRGLCRHARKHMDRTKIAHDGLWLHCSHPHLAHFSTRTQAHGSHKNRTRTWRIAHAHFFKHTMHIFFLFFTHTGRQTRNNSARRETSTWIAYGSHMDHTRMRTHARYEASTQAHRHVRTPNLVKVWNPRGTVHHAHLHARTHTRLRLHLNNCTCNTFTRWVKRKYDKIAAQQNFIWLIG